MTIDDNTKAVIQILIGTTGGWLASWLTYRGKRGDNNKDLMTTANEKWLERIDDLEVKFDKVVSDNSEITKQLSETLVENSNLRTKIKELNFEITGLREDLANLRTEIKDESSRKEHNDNQSNHGSNSKNS